MRTVAVMEALIKLFVFAKFVPLDFARDIAQYVALIVLLKFVNLVFSTTIALSTHQFPLG